jgi:hypothetical protein
MNEKRSKALDSFSRSQSLALLLTAARMIAGTRGGVSVW